jgi:hypothetical protein
MLVVEAGGMLSNGVHVLVAVALAVAFAGSARAEEPLVVLT